MTSVFVYDVNCEWKQCEPVRTPYDGLLGWIASRQDMFMRMSSPTWKIPYIFVAILRRLRNGTRGCQILKICQSKSS